MILFGFEVRDPMLAIWHEQGGLIVKGRPTTGMILCTGGLNACIASSEAV